METIMEVIRVRQEVNQTGLSLVSIINPQAAVDLVNQYILNEDREILLVLVLNTKNQVTAIHRCHQGTLNASVASTKDIFKTAILNNAASIIIAHNHPSGIVNPSPEDIKLTSLVSEAGDILNIELLDHIIVGWQDGYYSFKEQGLI
jgi:DNA repair protein RadC